MSQSKFSLSLEFYIFYYVRYFSTALLLLFFLFAEGRTEEERLLSFSLGSSGAWTPQGLLVGSGFGSFYRHGSDGAFYQVRLSADYMYESWFSGGAEVRITGGIDEVENTFAFNRYYLRTRFFVARGHFLVFAGPRVGMDQGFSDRFYLQSDVTNSSSSGNSGFNLSEGATFGAGGDMGLAWKFHSLWTLSGTAALEWTIPQQLYAEIASAIAFDLSGAFPSLRRSVSLFYLYIEASGLYRKESFESSPTIGFSIGF